jgi:ubiquitin carboxyl-terminal hydrolase 5/13
VSRRCRCPTYNDPTFVQTNDTERAVEWLFSHPDDTGEDTPAGDSGDPSALPAPGGSSKLPAKYNLKAFVSHKGPSVHSGHYVAHIHKAVEGGEGWVLFNDEKVVSADEENVDSLKPLAYLYFFERI